MYPSEIRDFVQQHLNDDLQALALKAKKYPNIDIPFALLQIESRKQIREKLPEWYANADVVFPQKITIEQCSSQITAQYKQQLLRGDSLIDLTGGLGVDSYYFAKKTQQSIYVEQNPLFHQAATHNFKALSLDHIKLINAQSEQYITTAPTVDTIYIDPARRDNLNRRLFSLADTQPNVSEMLPHIAQRCKRLIVKASTMADISHTISELKSVSEVHIVAWKGECKELLFVCDFDQQPVSTRYTAVNIQTNNSYTPFVFTETEEATTTVIFDESPQGYLYEPDSSLLKAGAFRLVASRFGLRKIALNSHLYTSDKPIEGFPGRRFKIIETVPFSSANNKRYFSRYRQANLAIRNFPLSVAELRKKWNMQEGGKLYLFATTSASHEKIIIITEKG